MLRQMTSLELAEWQAFYSLLADERKMRDMQSRNARKIKDIHEAGGFGRSRWGRS